MQYTLIGIECLTKHLRKSEKRLRKLQKDLSRKQKGSNNRNKTRLTVAKLFLKIVDKRKDFLHKLSTKLSNRKPINSNRRFENK